MTSKNKKEIARGFTLIETLVAVLILASAIAGPLTIASKGLSAANLARSQTTAQFLAQDALEYVRFTRDSNRLAGAGWLGGLAPCISTDGSAACYLDSLAQNPGAATACPGGVCPALLYDPSGHSFSYIAGGTATAFIRTVSIANDPSGASPDEAVVRVVVFWRDNLNTTVGHQVVILENLFNWQ